MMQMIIEGVGARFIAPVMIEALLRTDGRAKAGPYDMARFICSEESQY